MLWAELCDQIPRVGYTKENMYIALMAILIGVSYAAYLLMKK